MKVTLSQVFDIVKRFIPESAHDELDSVQKACLVWLPILLALSSLLLGVAGLPVWAYTILMQVSLTLAALGVRLPRVGAAPEESEE